MNPSMAVVMPCSGRVGVQGGRALLTSVPQIIVGCSSAAAVVLFAVMWGVKSARHRSHLGQCWAWLHRLDRLDRRLTGCVTEIERYLQRQPQLRTGWIPEAL